MADADHEWLKATTNPTADTGSAGGAKTSSVISGAGVGEVLTRLKAAASGTPDDSGAVRKQWQKLFSGVNSASVESALDVSYYIGNGIIRPSAAGAPKLVTTADESGKTARFIGPNSAGTLIITHDVNLTSTPGEHVGTLSMAWVERIQIRDTSSGAPAVLAADATAKVGTETVATMRAALGWATGEVQLATVASVDDSGTAADRRTAPAGITFYRAYSIADARFVRNDSGNADLAPGEAQGLWLQQILQPGMPNFLGIHLDLRIYGAWG